MRQQMVMGYARPVDCLLDQILYDMMAMHRMHRNMLQIDSHML